MDGAMSGGAPVGTIGAPLATDDVAVGVGACELVSGLTVSFAAGEFVAVLGRNGCGKTLTLHTLAGLRKPTSGTVLLDGIAADQHDKRSVARRLGLLAQDLDDGFVTTALETVLIGRHPHLSFWQWETAEDGQLARKALEAVDLGDFSSRRTDTMSGGEQRRVGIAALLAQAPGVYLLDEPTNHLDPHHQLAVLELFRSLARAGSTVIATLHDPTLAARFADRALLLFGDGRWSIGPSSETIAAESLSSLYLTPMVEVRQDGRRIFVPA
ncbi:MAG TPA: ABC transporter ATP-binding protein [Steroidobacteraceae bacterium]|nr:ABC transporter ATP-binding protein [Steroidobacteraceae bacterium]